MTSISTLGQALSQIDRIRDQQNIFSSLSEQLATGRRTNKFSGLGSDGITSQRARADLRSFDVFNDNITNADRRIQLTLTAVEEFQAQAENFADALAGFSQQSSHQQGEPIFFDDPTTTQIENTIIGYSSAEADIDLATLQDLANNIFDFLVDLVNAQEDERYLLGGAETLTQPLTDTGSLDTAITTLLNGFKDGTISTDNLIADLTDGTAQNGNPDAITDSIIGYSAALSSGNAGNVSVRVNGESEIDYTVVANADPFRDVLVAVAYFKNEALGPIADHVEIDEATGLPVILENGAPGETADESRENFFAVFNELATSVTRALDGIDQQRFRLEGTRARIIEIQRRQEIEQSVLQETVSDVEDVDINEVALQINTLQVQLDASFRVTARLQELSLVNFI